MASLEAAAVSPTASFGEELWLEQCAPLLLAAVHAISRCFHLRNWRAALGNSTSFNQDPPITQDGEIPETTATTSAFR
jgi:hypothetical protein